LLVKMTLAAATPADAELLRRYAHERSEEAFAELVRRHLDLVHSAALRQVGGNRAAAADIAQAVFTELARQANHLTRHPALVGWLYTTTHRLAARHVRDETRRHRRERDAHAMQETHHSNDPEVDWSRLAPVLDEAMHELAEADRIALLLRHFEQRPFAEVGARLGLGENAARMRVERALDRLRGRLAKRGITSTGSALALALGGPAVVAAPAGLAANIAAGALTASTFGLLSFMASIKLKIGAVVVGFGLLGTALLVQQQHLERLRIDQSALTAQLAEQSTAFRDAQQLIARKDAELAAAQDSRAELLRLRGEVARLNRGSANLSGLAKPPPNSPDRAQAPRLAWSPGQFLPENEWRDFGAETPEAAAATHLWALRHGNVDRLAEVTNLNQDAVKKMKQLPTGALMELLGMSRVRGATLLESHEPTPTTCELTYEASWEGDIPNGMSSGLNPLRAIKSGNLWKILMPGPIGDRSAGSE
jgi:RNA polymerase sigma factor (sigma-70 family)